jgi:hypothetical protein
MGRVLTNNVTLAVAPETTFNTQPTAGWMIIEPTSIGKFGPTLTKLTRTPISKNRQHRKGALTDLNSSVEFEVDVTYDHLKMFVEGLMFSVAKGGTIFPVTGVTATGFTVAAGGNLPDGTLISVRGCANAANNGIHVLAGTSIVTELKCINTVIESGTTARGVVAEVCGVQGAIGDFDIDAGGNLTSSAFNWTTGVGAMVQVGQFVWVGDTAGGAHSFATAANRGLARVIAKAAGKLTFDKKSSVFVAEANTTILIYVLFGEFIRNVAVDHADYLERTFQFELAYENLGPTPGSDKFEYAQGNFCNEITFDFQTASKATMKCNFVGTDTPSPVDARATGADTPVPAVATTMYNTSSDFMRLRVTGYDESALTTDLKSLSLMIKNNVSPEKVLGTLGGKYMNAGLFDVTVDAKVLLTDAGVLAAMRSNATVTMEVCIHNGDGGVVFDIPSMTVEGGDKTFPINQTVDISMKSQAFQDGLLGTSVSVSTFPYLPAA